MANDKKNGGKAAETDNEGPAGYDSVISGSEAKGFWRGKINDELHCKIIGKQSHFDGEVVAVELIEKATIRLKSDEGAEAVEVEAGPGQIINVNVRANSAEALNSPAGTKVWLKVTGKRTLKSGNTVYDYKMKRKLPDGVTAESLQKPGASAGQGAPLS